MPNTADATVNLNIDAFIADLLTNTFYHPPSCPGLQAQTESSSLDSLVSNEVAPHRILASMEIEQKLPDGPNFGLVVGLACATLLIIFVLALFFIHFDGKHLTFRHHSQHPTSQLSLPAASRTPAVA